MNNNYGYHLMAKPMGAVCNLACKYCFYLEKKSLFKEKEDYRMPYNVLEAYVKNYIETQNVPLISFVWQGGEPMLIGIDFYKKAIELQKKYSAGKKITNSIQTNGILMDDEWAVFFKNNNFMVGLSLDGPKHVHDKYRVDTNSNPTFDKVMNALEIFKSHNIEYNILASVSLYSSLYALEIYDFFKSNNIKFIQFTPLVERLPDEKSQTLGFHYSMPNSTQNNVTDFTVDPIKYGDFLISIFDKWVKNDVGEIFVMNFEWALTSWLLLPNTICIFSDKCGGCAVIEHNGDIYSCDHYVYPDYKLGNIVNDDVYKLMTSQKQVDFGESKEKNLPESCKLCDAFFACRGECPRHRFNFFPSGEYNKSYLCDAYQKYFRHIHPYMKAMRQLIENNLPVSDVMTLDKNPIVIVNKK